MSSHLGKRRRGGALRGAPVSALAARKAAKAAAASFPAQIETKISSASESEPDAQLESILDTEASNRNSVRYFQHPPPTSIEPAETNDEPPVARETSPRWRDIPEHASLPKIRLDVACYSTWQPKLGDNFSTEENRVRIRMQAGEQLVLQGVADLSVETGHLSIAGATISAGMAIRVYAPATSPLPIVESGAECRLSLLPARTGIERICRLAQEAGLIARGDNIWGGGSSDAIPPHSGFDVILQPKPRLLRLRQPQSWSSAMRHATDVLTSAERPVILLTGFPRTGKTMLARYLLNDLLKSHEQVDWLDCDLGQSEFTPPGFVSLLSFSTPVIGPSFCHVSPRRDTRAHYIGAIEARSHPRYFLDAVADLAAQWDRRTRAPLIVNLPGWSKGLGADLQVSLERVIRAAVQIHIGTVDDIEKSDATPDNLFFAEPVGDEASEILRMSGAAKRQLSLLSWLHCIPHDSPATPSWDFDVPLLARRPLLLPFAQVQAIHAVLPEAPPESELLHLLNGSLVALLETAEKETSGGPMSYIADPTLNPGSNALGLALIRAVDSEASCLHVLSPIPAHLVQNARVLSRGAIEVPTVALIDLDEEDESGIAGVEWKHVPFLEERPRFSGTPKGLEQLGSGPRRIRRNVMRKSLAAHTS